MLIPIPEIQNNHDHYQFKASYESALVYQLEKVLFLTKKVENNLENQACDLRWYIAEKELSYNMDALISSLSILTEYYHGWVIFSHIGTTSHKKTKYSPLKKDEKLNDKIARIFKDNSIGILSIVKEYKGDYYEDCKQAFLQAYEFLFIGKFHEIYVLNNYLKHNMITMGYAPKAILVDRQISIPYVHIDRPNDRLLNPSIYKYLFEYELDSDGKVTSASNDYFIDIINTTARPVCTVGRLKIYNINGIDYLKGGETVGLSMESIVDMAQELTQNIVKVFLGSSKGNMTREQRLSSLISEITERTPQTLSKLIKI